MFAQRGLGIRRTAARRKLIFVFNEECVVHGTSRAPKLAALAECVVASRRNRVIRATFGQPRRADPIIGR
jgi:hypothetical protein